MKGTVEKEGTSWLYVVDLGKDEYGKRKRKKKRGFKTKKEAQQALTKLLHEVNAGAYVEPSNQKSIFPTLENSAKVDISI